MCETFGMLTNLLFFAMAHRIEGESGPSHEKRFVCSVEITIEEEEGVFLRTCGYEKSRVKDAENSAASVMLMALLGV